MADKRRSDGEVAGALDSVFVTISTNQRVLLTHVAELDQRDAWRADGCRDMAQWLSGRLGISGWTARRWVNAAHALERLPRLADALANGELSLDKTLELARFARPDTEEDLIRWARRVLPQAVRRKADIACHPTSDETKDVERSRFLRWWWFDEGRRLGIEGEFAAAQGAVITSALERVAEDIPELPAPETGVEPTSEDLKEQRLADALLALSSQRLAADTDADRATVVVHTTLDTIRGAAGELERGPVLHPDVVRRLSCDCRLQFVLGDLSGNALGIGGTSRSVPPWLMRVLRQRDGGCTFPGCSMKRFIQAHHIIHWEDGGPTDLPNLVCVCHFHHKLVHEFGWKVKLEGSIARWCRPDGRRYAPGPAPPANRDPSVPVIPTAA